MYSMLRTISLSSYFFLLAAICVAVYLGGPEGIAAKATLALLVNAGLLLVVYILLRGTKRSYIWLCFILLMYFVYIVQALFTPTNQAMVQITRWLILTAIVICFCSSMMAVRLYPVDEAD